MGATRRIISGTIASWVIIGVGIAAQLLTVPIFLSHWRIEEYGAWLTIQSITALIFTLDRSHQQYVGYEFIRIHSQDTNQLGKYLISSVVVAVTVSMVEFLILWGLANSHLTHTILAGLMGQSGLLVDESIKSLLVLQLYALVASSAGGVLGRATYALGYYPRMTWWAALLAINAAITPAILVSQDFNLFHTVLLTAIANFAINVPLHIDMIRLLLKNNISLRAFSWKLGWKNFLNSLPLFGKESLENLRQSGIRLILSPLAGAKALVTFTTLRTGANVAFQGLNTITNPLMPELIRFVHQRKQVNIETAFASIWLIVICLMVPGVVILQFFVEPLFVFWTKGHIVFDGWVFGLLSLSVIVYAMAQPAISIITGNNLSNYQFKLSLFSTLLLIALLFLTVPMYGILGAAAALLFVEVIACVANVYRARKWLIHHELAWPQQSFNPVVFSVCLATVAIFAYNIAEKTLWVDVLIFIPLLGLTIRKYWQSLPHVAIERTKEIIAGLQNRFKAFTFNILKKTDVY